MDLPRKAMGRALPAPAAFTLVEVLITSAVIVVVGATALYALTMINGYAAASRVQAAAQCIVQNQIDQILTTGPYVPTNTPADIPAILATGTTSNNIAVFTDPETSAAQVTGTLTTDIRDSGAVSSGTPLYVLRAAVKLRYNFRGKAFQIAMNTLRAPDQ